MSNFDTSFSYQKTSQSPKEPLGLGTKTSPFTDFPITLKTNILCNSLATACYGPQEDKVELNWNLGVHDHVMINYMQPSNSEKKPLFHSRNSVNYCCWDMNRDSFLCGPITRGYVGYVALPSV